MNDYVKTYASALKAYDMLTGKIDKDELRKSLREGLVALAAASDSGLSVRVIETATGISKSKVERDIRAGKILANHPKASPVVVKGCTDVLTATQVDKAMSSDKPIAALSKAKADKLAGQKTAPKTPDVDPDAGEGEGEAPEAPAAPAAKSPATPDEQMTAALAILAPLAKSGGKVSDKLILAASQVLKHIATNSGQVAKSA